MIGLLERHVVMFSCDIDANCPHKSHMTDKYFHTAVHNDMMAFFETSISPFPIGATELFSVRNRRGLPTVSLYTNVDLRE